MCQGDFHAKQGSIDDSLTESENLIYMRTYDNHMMTGMCITRDFPSIVFSHTPDLELAAYLRPEIDPSVMNGFNNLTHLVLDGMTIEDYKWTWHDQAESLANVLIRSPQMRKFGLYNIGCQLEVDETPYFFVLVSDAFAKNNSSTKLRLNTLLPDSYQYPPPSDYSDDPGRYISQLTDVRYLQHLYLGGAYMDRPTYDIARFSGVVVIDPIIRPVLLPSFISHETTPNLRRLSVDIPPQQWLEMINFSQSEFATQLSIHLHFNWDWRHRLVEWQSSFIRWAQNLQDDLFYETKWNFRSTILELHWSHEHSKNADHIKHASIPRNCLAQMKRTGQDTLKDLAIYLKNDDRHEPPVLSPPDQYWCGPCSCVGCLPSRSMVETVEHTIMSFFGGIGAGFIERLYIPLTIRTNWFGWDNPSEEEIDGWKRRLIHELAAESCLPGLRYVKLHGPAYEIDRRPGGEIGLLKLGWAEEREIELFRADVWEPWWS
ncbi:hypothetical protein V8F06_004873 [Rhypophila decipiens]